MAESEEELNGLLMKVKEESEKVGLKLSTQKDHGILSHDFMAIGGEGVIAFIILGSKITADGNCSHEIKRHLLLGRKAMTNLDSMLKADTLLCQQRSAEFSTKVSRVQVMVFPIVMYRCENWTIKKAEHQRIDAFELWCWRRLLTVPWTAKRSTQSILKEISPEYSFGRTDAETETPILLPPDAKN